MSFKKSILFAVTFLFSSLGYTDTIVRMKSAFGDIDVKLHPESAPKTVANFLRYVLDGEYDKTFIHRSIPNFVIQGGTFALDNNGLVRVSQYRAVVNEFNISNTRGTLAMAKLSNDPNSATNGWFFNLKDNNSGTATSGNLDLQNSGFTVFGTIINGLDVMDTIAGLPVGGIINLNNNTNDNGELTRVPIADGGSVVNEASDLVAFDMELIEIDVSINSGLNGYWFNPETSGQGWGIEILPSLNKAFMAWFTYDSQSPQPGTFSEIGAADNRWMSSLGNINLETKTITFDLAVTSNGLFDTPTTVNVSEANSIGEMSITFNSCNSATLTYSLVSPAVSNTMNLIRISDDNVKLCEKLSAQALSLLSAN